MLVFKYHLSREEYLDYNYFTAWSSPQKKAYRVRYYLRVMALYIAIAGLYIFAKSSHNPIIDSAIFVGIGTTYFLLIPFLVRRSIRTRVSQILARPENQHVLSQSTVMLSDDGIKDSDAETENWYTWDSITRKSETERCYYLYTNSYHAVVIPKRILSGPDTKALHLLFEKHLPLYADLDV